MNVLEELVIQLVTQLLTQLVPISDPTPITL